MNRLTTLKFSLCLLAPFALAGETIHGSVTDPSKAPISGAQVAAINRIGVVAQTSTDSAGRFEIPIAERLIVTASGFETKTVAPDVGKPLTIELAIAPQTDSIRVV